MPGTVGQGECQYSACNTPSTPFFCISSSTPGDADTFPGACYATELEALAACSICLDCTGTEPVAVHLAGSPCGDNNKGDLVCAQDGSTMLLCGTLRPDGGIAPVPDSGADASGRGNTFVAVGACPQGQTCSTIQGTTSVECGLPNSEFNVAFAIEGGPCAGDAAAACSFDCSLVLVCQQGIWQQSRVCGTAATHCDIILPGYMALGGGTCPASSTTGCIDCLP
jgi:hypothetical protein